MKRIVLLAVLAAPAAGWAADAGRAKKDNNLICRSIGETGSRVAKKRVCLTRAEWAEQKRIQRMDLERAQSNRLPPGAQ